MNPTSSLNQRSSQTYGSTDPVSPLDPDQKAGNGDTAGNKPSGPPLRNGPETYRGPNQPAWLEDFFTGKWPITLDVETCGQLLWTEKTGMAEEFQAWYARNENKAWAEELHDDFRSFPLLEEICQAWCMKNNEADALLWLIEKVNKNSVCIKSKNFGEDSADWIEALARETRIDDISIRDKIGRSDTSLSTKQVKLLNDMLVRKKSLANLEIASYPLFDSLREGIGLNSSLKNLKMVLFTNHEEGDWEATMEMIKNHESLESIEICTCKLRPEKVDLIFRNARKNPRIQAINIAGASPFGNSDIGKAEFATTYDQLLEYNHSLKTLCLQSNSLNDRDADAIANALRKNKKLAKLDLSMNCIFKHGGLAIADMLASNTTLYELNISFNSLGEEVGAALASSLEMNTTLEHLDSNFCGFSDQDQKTIRRITERNKQARVSRERDAMLFDRNGASPASWLPPEISEDIMNRILMLSDTHPTYEFTAEAVQLSLNVLDAQLRHESS